MADVPSLHDDRRHSDEISAWVRRHQERAWRFVRMCGCPADVAEDLVQEALMAAVHKHVYVESDARAEAWLRNALRNLWAMHLRTEGRRVRHIRAAAAARALDDRPTDQDTAGWLAALRECLRGVDGRARQLLEGHYRDGQSREALARALNMRASGIKAFLRRVRASLRDCVLRRLRREGNESR